MTDAVRTRVIDILQSASVKGSVPITERVLNEVANQAIAAKPGRVKQFDIQIGTENYLEAGVRVSIGPITKWFRPEIVVTAAASVITFTLASREYGSVMWLAELFAKERLPAGVRINGRQITLDLRDVPQLAAFRSLLNGLTFTSITTRKGTMVVDFELARQTN